MMNKRASQISSMVFSVIVVGMFIAAAYAMMESVSQNYDLSVDTTQLKTFQRINDTSTQISLSVLNDTLEGGGAVTGAGENSEFQLGVMNKGLKTLVRAPTYLTDMAYDGYKVLTDVIGIDSVFLQGTIAIIALLGTVGILSLLFRKDA